MNGKAICLLLVVLLVGGCSVNSADKPANNASISETNSAVPAAAKEQNNIVSTGQTITVQDFCAVTIDKAEFVDKISPSNPSSYHSYYQAKTPDATLFNLVTHIKNLQGTAQKTNSFVSVELIYNDKYHYKCSDVLEDSSYGGGNNLDPYTSVTSIDPLTSKTMHYIVLDIPKEMATDDKPVNAIITIQGQKYQLKVK
jgi:hypothetical protein